LSFDTPFYFNGTKVDLHVLMCR